MLFILALWNYLLFEHIAVKAKIFVLGIMLFSSSGIALADSEKVDEKLLQAHREFEKKNLQQTRFKTESGLFDSVSDDPDSPTKNFRFRDKSGSLPEWPDRSEFRNESGFTEYHLNQNGIPLQPHYPRKFKCEPSLSKSWKDYGKSNETKEGINRDKGCSHSPPVFELSPNYRDKPPHLSMAGCYQYQEWDSNPFLENRKNNCPSYVPFEGWKIEQPPPPPLTKTLSKENRSGDSP